MKSTDKLNYTFLVIILIVAINYLLLPIFDINIAGFPRSPSPCSNNLHTAMDFLVLAYPPCKSNRINKKRVNQL